MAELTAIPIGILTPSGLVSAPYTAISLADAVPKEPQGVYTVGRTFRRDHILLLDDHLARLEESARLEGINAKIDRAALRAAMRTLIDQSGYEESRFRLTVPHQWPDHVYISLERFKPLAAEIYTNGVQVATISGERHNPAAKSTAWMTERKPAVESLAPGVYEGILVSHDGFLLEGTTSNFYAVMDGRLYTAGEGVLAGMARRIVLKLAPAVLPVEMKPIRGDALWAVEEAFLTSASRGIIPVVMINTQIIGAGQPGSFTLRLRDEYNRWVETHIEPL